MQFYISYLVNLYIAMTSKEEQEQFLDLCANGSLDLVSRLLDKDQSLIESRDSGGM